MALEIEMKARVADRGRVEAALARLGRRVRDFSKADAYYLFPGAEPGQGRTFRIRWDGGKAAQAIVTWKERSREGGLEINREHEFTVSDPEEFAGLCLAMGAREYFHKAKRGTEWAVGELCAELVEVPPLGTFLEVERVIESVPEKNTAPQEAATAAAIRAQIMELFSACGLSEADIEERYYSQMLRETGAMAWACPSAEAGSPRGGSA